MNGSGDLAISAPTVVRLVAEQFPGWRRLPVRHLDATGTVNTIVRIGDDLTARFPRQPDEPAAVRRRLVGEAEAARELLGRTRFPTPEPVALGEPGHGYPLPWSIQTWLPGVPATVDDPGGSAGFAGDLVELVGDLRAIGTRGRTFSGSYRGGDLHDHDAWMQTCFARSERLLDVPRLRRCWQVLRELPREAPDVMSHGDLIPGNVLVREGRLTGVLDVGGLAPADPALDLVAAWHLLEDGPRRVLRDGLGCSELDWGRGQAWAFEQAMGLVWSYASTNPTMSRLGRRTLARLLAEPGLSP